VCFLTRNALVSFLDKVATIFDYEDALKELHSNQFLQGLNAIGFILHFLEQVVLV